MIHYFPVVTGSLIVSGNLSVTGTATVSASSATTASNALTASSADTFIVRNNLTGSNALFSGAITAQTLVVQTITSSIEYATGSNRFGSLLTDRQTFTGSLFITGSSANFSNQVCGLMGNFSCVGIGTTTPGYKLDVCGTGYIFSLSGGGSSRIASTVNNTSGNLEFGLEGSAGNQLFTGMGAYQAGIGTSNNTNFNIATNTNVRATVFNTGIACFACQVCSGAGFYASSVQSGITIDSTTNGDTIIASRGLSTALHGIVRTVGQNGATCMQIISTRNSVDGNLPASVNALWGLTNSDMVIATCNTERMRVTSGGSVGIGTISPASPLSVQWDRSSKFSGIGVYDSQVYNASNHGGTITFGGTYTSGGSYTEWTAVGGIKENTNDSDYAGALALYTRPNTGGMCERLRITSGGSVSIGSTSAAYNFNVYATSGNDGWGAFFGGSGTTKGGIYIGNAGNQYGTLYFDNANNNVYLKQSYVTGCVIVIANTGGVYLANGGTSWAAISSDERKKKNFETTQGLAEVLQIEPIKYHFKQDDNNSIKRLGFKAQNIKNLIPEMVLETGEFAEDNSPYLTIMPDYILPVLVKGMQEQHCIICSQASIINTLKTCIGIS